MTEKRLESVDFASDEAAERAFATGLTPEDFEGREPSGSTGGFTVKDVAQILATTDTAPGSTEPYRVEMWAGHRIYVSDDPPFSHTDESVVRRRLGL